MKVVVDFDLCEANGYCMKAAPEAFKLDDEDKLHVLVTEAGEELHDKLRAAARRCPRKAITLVEE